MAPAPSRSRFEDMLAVGDLRSDGLANEVVRIVTERPELIPDLLEALRSEEPSVRGHAADALEKVSRIHPQPVRPFLASIARQAVSDDVPMVRWHLAMVLGHISVTAEAVSRATQALLRLLSDPSAFVRSWAIAELAILAQRSPHIAPSVVRTVSPLISDPSPAVAKRAAFALRALTDPARDLPRSWVKTGRR